jgi:hypothetical protein
VTHDTPLFLSSHEYHIIDLIIIQL